MFVLALALLAFAIFYNQRRTKFELRENKLLLNQQKALTEAEYNSSEHERERIARLLHDDINNQLTFLRMSMQTLKDKEVKTELIGTVDQTISEIRTLSHTLSTQQVIKFGLFSALEGLSRSFAKAKTLELQIVKSTSWKQQTSEIEIVIYRICQEWIGNSLKHGEAKQVKIFLDDIDGPLLKYEDDGKGFDQDVLQKGHGMTAIEGRIKRINGTLQTESTPGNGVTYLLQWERSM